MRCRSNIVRQVTLETFVHATEDEDKVIKAMNLLIPPGVAPKVDRSTVRGHHGNPIGIIRYSVTGCEAEEVVRHILSNMDEIEKNVVRLSLDDRVEGNKLFLSFNKQSASLGVIEVGTGDDVIRVVISLNTLALRGRKPVEALSNLDSSS